MTTHHSEYGTYNIVGVNRRSYPGPSENERINVTTVLVLGDVGDYAAYTAASGNPQFCARYGDKISFEEACIHFPGGQLEKELYRL